MYFNHTASLRFFFFSNNTGSLFFYRFSKPAFHNIKGIKLHLHRIFIASLLNVCFTFKLPQSHPILLLLTNNGNNGKQKSLRNVRHKEMYLIFINSQRL